MFMPKVEVLHLTPRERGELQLHLRKQGLPPVLLNAFTGFSLQGAFVHKAKLHVPGRYGVHNRTKFAVK
jgi:hypothetical protein